MNKTIKFSFFSWGPGPLGRWARSVFSIRLIDFAIIEIKEYQYSSTIGMHSFAFTLLGFTITLLNNKTYSQP